ncbi:Fe-S oxidoreductase [Longilinea arvoryzae]|uniref:Fe-S oxidoreductase n=1 Tax=Longilinea arvoryzae TaxID=360412 RepID=A0A0S7BDE8_9CHLR|nr:radical SAM protein [Longilinea arvoryzae]GAP15790.1 Fe-S oxidoreductase [Longilinea arvoryzae]
MPRIALIYPYFRTRSANEILFPPLGEAYLASQLHGLGIETRIFDCTFETFEITQKKLEDYHPDIVGIYVMVTLSRNAFRIAEMVRRKLSESLLVAGGPLPTLYPEQYCDCFDVVFRGEVDISFPSFCRDYFDLHLIRNQLGELPLDTYAGLFIQNENFRINNPVVHHNENELASFALPYRDDFDHAAYQKVWQQQDGSKTTSLMTTFGCPFDCDFCSRPVFGDQFRRRNLDKVFAEIEQIRSLGYDSLWIADDNFTLDQRFLKEFCKRMIGSQMQWSCLSRVTGINEEIVGIMKDAGCRRVYLGLESGNQGTLKLMNKQTTLEEGQNAVHLFHNGGIEVAAFFIVGYPGETTASIEDTFRYALELPINLISFNIPFPLPGSQLYEHVSKLDKNKDWNVENEVTFVYESEFDSEWLQRRINQTMQAFAEKYKKR